VNIWNEYIDWLYYSDLFGDDMPKQYEAIRDKLKSEGMSNKSAKTEAAKTYNSKHPGRPVTRKSK